jgi:hypothetical protein
MDSPIAKFNKHFMKDTVRICQEFSKCHHVIAMDEEKSVEKNSRGISSRRRSQKMADEKTG